MHLSIPRYLKFTVPYTPSPPASTSGIIQHNEYSRIDIFPRMRASLSCAKTSRFLLPAPNWEHWTTCVVFGDGKEGETWRWDGAPLREGLLRTKYNAFQSPCAALDARHSECEGRRQVNLLLIRDTLWTARMPAVCGGQEWGHPACCRPAVR